MTSREARTCDLREYFSTADQNALRPIITSLNGDNSWLWSFPRPASERSSTGRLYYHIVFEPWLSGPTSQLSSWLIHISLSSPAAATCGGDVEEMARQIEIAASSWRSGGDRTPKGVQESKPVLDAILMGFHYADHLHEPTLRTFDKRTPVIASCEAAKKIRTLSHFDTISEMTDFSSDARSWNTAELHPDALPRWLTPLRLPGHHELNYCLALIWTHESKVGQAEIHEAILQTPHGTRLDQKPLQAFLNSEPAIEKLAMFHGLKESHAAGSQNTYGATGGLELFRAIGGAKYWVLSHSSLLQYTGALMRMLWVTDTPRTIEWALEREASTVVKGDKGKLGKPDMVDVQNGKMFVLR
ncbi:hypothetical protein BDY17DRAFT_322981 [Neohortaea acidophila]|uniref:Uncharacterized protein n=1 Tax=Neohortaea acidophila TaxID=245834 RepID=A0A6A6PY07_9PEZI|nr:uncharacterized protein BDY17DRAFT_322981 [Neohortaea acidophila]KAF2484107.1 hypothetical protein BDY17DRAFT_322981 [Neohortaea acidophila]